MLADIAGGQLDRLWARIKNPPTQRDAFVTLVVTAWLSFMVWVLLLVRPFNLLAYYPYSQLNLYGFSWVNPFSRGDLLVAFVILSVLYYVGWRAARQASGREAWLIVIWGSLAFGLALLFVYPVGSTDIWDYIVHGRIVGVYGSNPFTLVGYDFPKDPFFPYMGWPGASSAYGPVWELMAGLTARLAGDGVVANVLAFKALSGLFLLATAAAATLILRAVPARRSARDLAQDQPTDGALAAFVLIAWNPIILYETLANGHNDIVMVCAVMWAAWALLRRHYTLSVLALLAGTLVKFMPVLLIPAAGLIALRDLPNRRAQVRFVAVTAVVSMALLVLAWLPFWTGVEVLGVARREQLFTTSLPSVFFAWLSPVWGAARAGAVVSKAAAGLTILFALYQAVRAWGDRSWTSFVVSAFNTFMFYLLVTVLWFMPWYALWPLSLAALLPSARPLRLAQVFGLANLFQPVVAASMMFWASSAAAAFQQTVLAALFLALPWLYVVFGRSRARVSFSPGQRAAPEHVERPARRAPR